MWSEELQSGIVERLPFGASEWAISVEGGTFKWGSELEPLNLCDVNFKVTLGSIVAVVGKVGMDKSSLLAAMLEKSRWT